MRALVLSLLGLSLLGACDGQRRISGGATTPLPRADAAVRIDAGLDDAGLDDAGFDDAGRPVTVDAGVDDAGNPVVRDGGPSTRDGGASIGTAEDFCRERTRLTCEANQRCCTRATGLYPSVDACIRATTDTVCFSGVAFDDGRVLFDARIAADILAELEARTTACQYADRTDVPVSGTLPEGSDCTAAGPDLSPLYACSPGTYCRGREEGSLQCVRFVGLGEDCTNDRCLASLTCDLETRRCRNGNPTGSACGEGEGQCLDGYCVNATCTLTPPAEDYCEGE